MVEQVSWEDDIKWGEKDKGPTSEETEWMEVEEVTSEKQPALEVRMVYVSPLEIVKLYTTGVE